MKIKKSDLKIRDHASFSYSSFPHLRQHNLGDPSFSVEIGSFEIAKVVIDNKGIWHVSNVFSRYKSYDGAIKGILRRLNRV